MCGATSIQQTAIALVAVVLCGVASSGQAQAGEDQWESRIRQMERVWNPEDPKEFYQQAGQMFADLEHVELALKTGVATAVVESMVAKTAAPGSAGVIEPLTLGKAMVVFLELGQPNYSRTNARLLCRLRGKLKSQMIPNFIALRVYTNVAPPPGVRGMAGMDPAAIKDPEARSKYEAAIRENQRNNEINSHQMDVISSITKFDPFIEQYLTKTFSGKSDLSAELKECLEVGGFSGDEKAALIKKIN